MRSHHVPSSAAGDRAVGKETYFTYGTHIKSVNHGSLFSML